MEDLNKKIDFKTISLFVRIKRINQIMFENNHRTNDQV